MKIWLGVLGRAFIEFAIILLLISFIAGGSMFVSAPSGEMVQVYRTALRAALELMPLAAILTLFLAFFSFELRIPSRAAGLLGLFILGACLLSAGIGLRSLGPVRGALAERDASPPEPALQGPGIATQRGRIGLWIGAYDEGQARDAAAVDFGAEYPRLVYEARAPIDSGQVAIQGRDYRATLPEPELLSIVPEASVFAGAWIWDRLARMAGGPIAQPLAAAGGFLLLALGFRFLCRATGWPLANALLAAAGLAGLVALDAVLSTGAPAAFLDSLGRRARLPLAGPYLIAGAEGLLGLLLCGGDLASALRGRRRGA